MKKQTAPSTTERSSDSRTVARRLISDKLASKKRFISYAARMMDQHGEEAITIVHCVDGQRIPIDLGEIDNMSSCELEMYHDNELLMQTRIGEQIAEPRGIMRDPAMYTAATNSRVGAQILDSMDGLNKTTMLALREERAQSQRYREDADHQRNRVMDLERKLMEVTLQLEAKGDDDSMAPVIELAKTAWMAWQSKDFRSELMTRAKQALVGVSDEEAEIITRFLNRPEFTAMGVLTADPVKAALDQH